MLSEGKSVLWWVNPKPNPHAALRLLCFPYAGGSASIFRAWHLALPNEVEVYSIQLPGRATRISERPFTRVSDLVEELAPALVRLLEKPVVFFGHSMGAILSFEVTRWLRRHGHLLPRHLFMSGRRAPQIPDTDPLLHLMNDADFLANIRELNGTPTEVLSNAELMRLALPALRADVELCETYEYCEETPLSCPITAFVGLEDQEESLDKVDGWRLQTNTTFSIHPMRGDHFYIHSNEDELLKLLRGELYRTLIYV